MAHELTVPGVLERAADAVRLARGHGRRRATAGASPSWRDGSTRRRGPSSPAGSSRATGSRSGARTWRSGPSPPSASTAPARWSSRSTPGSRAREAAYILEASGARLLFTVTDFLDTDYVAMLAGGGPSAHPRGDRRAAGPGRRRHRGVGRLPRPRPTASSPASRAERAAAIDPDDLADILFTSGTTGRPKGAMLAPRRLGAGLHGLGRCRRPARRRPLPHRQPVLPRLRAQGRDPRLRC